MIHWRYVELRLRTSFFMTRNVGYKEHKNTIKEFTYSNSSYWRGYVLRVHYEKYQSNFTILFHVADITTCEIILYTAERTGFLIEKKTTISLMSSL